jgi:hypothetical protein
MQVAAEAGSTVLGNFTSVLDNAEPLSLQVIFMCKE